MLTDVFVGLMLLWLPYHLITWQQPNLPTDSIANSEAVTDVSAIAKQVTVRILTTPGIGSGVIIQRVGQTYTVLTNAHVVADSLNRQYQVLTADGLLHPARWQQPSKFKDLDLALVQFTSKQIYQVATFRHSQLRLGEPVYAAGFPTWHYINQDAIESTRDWGLKALYITTGKLGMILEKPLEQGYQLGYTNSVENGMSGGPVLDRQGKLVGINGRLKYPFQGIDAFRFADGNVPSAELFQQMESLSWSIPITTFNRTRE